MFSGMKKLILLLTVALTAVRCVPDTEDIYYSSKWSVKNSTGQVLTISPASCSGDSPYTLADGAEMNFYSRGEYEYRPYFSMIMVCWRGVPKDEIYFEVFDAEGIILTRWHFDSNIYYSGLSAKNFFNEYSWEHSADYDKRKKKKDHWSFEILPEDIR